MQSRILSLSLLLFWMILGIYGPSVPPYFIAQTVFYEKFHGGDFPAKETYYNDPRIGQRVDYFASLTDQSPKNSEVCLFTNSSNIIKYFIFYRYIDTPYDAPLCFESSRTNSFIPLEFDLATAFGHGSVLNESTLTFLDQYNDVWYEVVNMGEYYYPRALSDSRNSKIFRSFAYEIPSPTAWELPNCIPKDNSTNTGSLVSPFPDAFSFSTYDYQSVDFTILSDYYFDTVNKRFRQDLKYTWNNLQTLTTIRLYNSSKVYVAVPWAITPTPCIIYDGPGPDPGLKNLNYYVTLNTKIGETFSIYGKYGSYFSFNQLGVLKALYTESERVVSNWSPTPPPPDTWEAPSKQCYPYPFGEGKPHPKGLASKGFASAFTIKLLSENYIITVYYNGDTKMWRYDFYNTTVIQKGNIQYTINNPFTSTPDITPLPCVSYNVPFSFPLSIPGNFTTYLGDAIYEDGNHCEVWAEGNIISWWVDYPVIFFGPNLPGSILNIIYNVGQPPTEVFDTPSVCVAN